MSGSTRPHDHIEELIAADALHGLDDRDAESLRAELAEHGPDCAECARLTAQYAEVAAGLAMSLPPEPLSAGAEQRLLRAAAQHPRTAGGEPPAGVVQLEDRRAGPGRARGPLMAAAVAAAIAVLAGTLGYLAAPGPSRIEVVAFPAEEVGRLVVAYQSGDEQGWVIGSLSEPPEGSVYELWVSRPGSEAVEPAGIFVPRDGSVLSEVTLGTRFDLLAVSVEPGFQDQPTTDPILVATVQ